MDSVATKKHTPTVRLRRLAAELRRLRAAAALSREAVTAQTGINNATLYRIESARTRPQMRTLTAMLTAYGTAPEQRDYLTALCRDAAQPGWLRTYQKDLPEEYAAYISFEDEAAGVRSYQSMFMPGLVQTEDYAVAAIRGALLSATDEQVRDRVQARMDRQRVLTKKEPLSLWAILDEAVLRRMVGGPEVMRAQLLHVLMLADLPHINIQVIPFGAGAHPGMQGAFVLMDFPDPLDTDLVYIDSMANELFLESSTSVRFYTKMFDTLRAIALSPGDSKTMIARLAEEIQ
jgi:transcriptional regulator with XRE-family HTH domain